MKKLYILIFCALAMGCDKTAPKLLPQAEELESEKVTDLGDFNKESFNTALDVLFVIDDSGSMMSHQQNLANNIPQFTNEIIRTKFLDYHIGVINSSDTTGYYSSTSCCGRLNGSPIFVDRTTGDPNGVLARNLMVGTNGSATEKFFGPVLQAFSPQNVSGYNQGFYRQQAYLALIFITDTDDQTAGMTSQNFLDALIQLKGSQEKIIVGAAYISRNDLANCSGESYEINNSTKLTDFFRMTNALAFSLCAPDYGKKLAEISKFIVNKARRKLLTKVPDPATIAVTIGALEVPNDFKTGWSYNAHHNSIDFGEEIDWDLYPEDEYPEISYETIPVTYQPQ